ncbi:MAG: hypothetical protein IPJ62_11090 [Betaproteobacteria bacterium]|nr:hypothetical protein [Betaproteobacteria bacterium]
MLLNGQLFLLGRPRQRHRRCSTHGPAIARLIGAFAAGKSQTGEALAAKLADVDGWR